MHRHKATFDLAIEVYFFTVGTTNIQPYVAEFGQIKLRIQPKPRVHPEPLLPGVPYPNCQGADCPTITEAWFSEISKRASMPLEAVRVPARTASIATVYMCIL